MYLNTLKVLGHVQVKNMLASTLRIGTDCSGIEAPVEALEQLGVQYRHVWSSEIDKHCIKSIKDNYRPERLYGDPDGPYPNGDIRHRDHDSLPDVDLYVCGFPCQPFSTAGSRQGMEDARGNVFWSCIDVIKQKEPEWFILENVKGILTNDKRLASDTHGRTWDTIWTAVKGLEGCGYYVDWRLLNTRDHGVPQNRERVFIVGSQRGSVKWPERCECPPISEFVDEEDTSTRTPSINCQKMLENIKGNTFINIGFPKNPHTDLIDCSPTLTAASSQIWNVPKQRYANVKEFLWLQGFRNLELKCSKTQAQKQIGNSMSVNVIKGIIKGLL